MLRTFLVILLSLGLMGQAKFASFQVHGPDARSPLMADLDFIENNPWSPDQPFLNSFKNSALDGAPLIRTSSCAYTQTTGVVPVDSNFYPTKLSPTGSTFNGTRYPLFGANSNIKAGHYHLYYDGTPGAGGALELCGSRQSNFTDDGVGTINVDINNGDTTAVYVVYYTTSTGGNLAAPLSNFRMCYAGNVPDTTLACKNGTEYFDPTFMANVTKFAGVRPIGWGQSLDNSTSLMDYPANVLPVTSITWVGSGLGVSPAPETPIEVQSQLCQEGGFTYCLFSMPQQMTDAYITHWATVAHSTITNSNTKVLLEHCDEVWNFASGYCASTNAVSTPMTTIFPSCSNGVNCSTDYHVYQTARLYAIWHSVWGANTGRVIASYGTQIGNFSNTQFPLSITAEAAGASSPTTVTFTGTTPVVVNWTGSSMAAGQAVSFSTTGSLPSGMIPTGAASDFGGIAVTFTNGSANISWTANGLLLNQPVYFDAGSFTWPVGLPTNFTADKVYYVVTTGTNTIQVSATIGGSAIVAASAPSGSIVGFAGPQDYYVTNDGSLGANSFHISDTLAHALAGTGTINVSGSASGTTTGYKLLWPNRLGDGNVDAINTATYFGDGGELRIDAWSADAGGMTKAFAQLTTGGQIPRCTGAPPRSPNGARCHLTSKDGSITTTTRHGTGSLRSAGDCL